MLSALALSLACSLPESVDPVTFDIDNDQLQARQLEERVDVVADRLNRDQDLNVLLVGHADEDNTQGYNLELSRRRAQEVMALMVARYPHLEGRISVEGRGEWDPTTTGDSEEAKAKNRRVEFVFHYKRQCEAIWSEDFVTCMMGRLDEAPAPQSEAPSAAKQVEPATQVGPDPVLAPARFCGLYGFVGAGWSVSSYDLVRHHLPWGVMGGYVWAPSKNLRLGAGAQLDHHAYLGFLFGSGSGQCTGECASPLHVLRILPEFRVGGASGPLWAHLRVFAGPALIVRPAHEETSAGQTVRIPTSTIARPNIGGGPGFAFALSRRLMLSLDFEVSFDGHFDEAAGVYGGKLSLGRFMGRDPAH